MARAGRQAGRRGRHAGRHLILSRNTPRNSKQALFSSGVQRCGLSSHNDPENRIHVLCSSLVPLRKFNAMVLDKQPVWVRAGPQVSSLIDSYTSVTLKRDVEGYKPGPEGGARGAKKPCISKHERTPPGVREMGDVPVRMGMHVEERRAWERKRGRGADCREKHISLQVQVYYRLLSEHGPTPYRIRPRMESASGRS